MNKNIDVERRLKRGEFKQALVELDKLPACMWRDTHILMCLRELARLKDAGALAKRLHNDILAKTLNYEGSKPSKSELRHLLRHIALILSEIGEHAPAVQITSKLCAESPKLVSLHRERAYTLSNAGDIDAAESALQHALMLDPLHAQSHAQLARLYCRTGRVDQGCSAYSRALALEPKNCVLLSRLAFWSNFTNHTTQRNQYQLSQLWQLACHFNAQQEQSARLIQKQSLKLGFVSSQLNSSNVLPCLNALLANLNTQECETVVYNDTSIFNKRLKSSVNVVETKHLSNNALVSRIQEDQVDILFDLTGHHSSSRLAIFAQRAAPVQISWLAYLSTTGLKQVDYRLTDRQIDPVGLSEEHYSETLVRMPHNFLTFSEPLQAPEIDKTETKTGLRFGSFNSLAKISPVTIDAWANCLHLVADSTLCLKRKQLNSESARNFYRSQFKQRGIDPERLLFLTSDPNPSRHLAHYNDIDIALDTSPVNGLATTFEALWMGTPVITFSGETSASRIGSLLLSSVNLEQLCATDLGSFANTAKQLANDPTRRSQLNKDLRKRLLDSELMNEQQFAEDFMYTVKQCWLDKCTSPNKEEGRTNG